MVCVDRSSFIYAIVAVVMGRTLWWAVQPASTENTAINYSAITTSIVFAAVVVTVLILTEPELHAYKYVASMFALYRGLPEVFAVAVDERRRALRQRLLD